jgi:hypothetical protein
MNQLSTRIVSPSSLQLFRLEAEMMALRAQLASAGKQREVLSAPEAKTAFDFQLRSLKRLQAIKATLGTIRT